MSRLYSLPSIEYGTPEDILQWSKETQNLKQHRKLLCIRKLMLEEDGVELQDVAKDFGVTTRTVNNWLRQWNKGGREALRIAPKPGRPRKFKEEHAKIVEDLINNQADKNIRLSLRGIHGFLKDEYKLDLCYSGLCWHVKKYGLQPDKTQT